MGDRNCAFEGCNSLEFRTSGYCLRHKGDSPGERSPVITGTDVVDSASAQDNPLLIPKIVLGFVVLVSSIGGWTFLFESAVCGLLFLPIYAVYLISWAWKRFKDGALTWFDAIFHIVSFIVLLGFCVLVLTLVTMGSPA